MPPSDGLGTTGELAVAAGRDALEMAHVNPLQIGMLILCTTTPDMRIPATSASVAGARGIRSGAMDVNVACSGFVHGLVTAAGLMATGIDRVLLIGSETLTQVTTGQIGQRRSISGTELAASCSKSSKGAVRSVDGTWGSTAPIRAYCTPNTAPECR